MSNARRISRPKKRLDRLAVAQVRRNRLEAQRLMVRKESAEVREGIDETVALAEGRGTVFVRPKTRAGEGDKPPKKMSGLEWLFTRTPARITEDQLRQGARWGSIWRAANAEAPLRTGAISDSPGGGRDDARSVCAALDDAAYRVKAQEKLAELNLVLLNQASLLGALADICGRELTPREASTDGHSALRLECLCCVALDMLVTASQAKPARVA